MNEGEKHHIIIAANSSFAGDNSMLEGINWIFFDLGSTLIDETAADARRITEMISGTDITEEAYREKRLERSFTTKNRDLLLQITVFCFLFESGYLKTQRL